MDPTTTLLDLINSAPIAVRQAFTDENVLRALRNIGVGSVTPIVVAQLHAPGARARATTGKGFTLCGESSAVRHEQVTCKHCLRSLGR